MQIVRQVVVTGILMLYETPMILLSFRLSHNVSTLVPIGLKEDVVQIPTCVVLGLLDSEQEIGWNQNSSTVMTLLEVSSGVVKVSNVFMEVEEVWGVSMKMIS